MSIKPEAHLVMSRMTYDSFPDHESAMRYVNSRLSHILMKDHNIPPNEIEVSREEAMRTQEIHFIARRMKRTAPPPMSSDLMKMLYDSINTTANYNIGAAVAATMTQAKCHCDNDICECFDVKPLNVYDVLSTPKLGPMISLHYSGGTITGDYYGVTTTGGTVGWKMPTLSKSK